MLCLKCHSWLQLSKIEKVPRGIRGEKSSKDMASSRNLVSTIGALASPKMGGRNQVSGRVSVPCWHATPVANAPWKPLNIGFLPVHPNVPLNLYPFFSQNCLHVYIKQGLQKCCETAFSRSGVGSIRFGTPRRSY